MERGCRAEEAECTPAPGPRMNGAHPGIRCQRPCSYAGGRGWVLGKIGWGGQGCTRLPPTTSGALPTRRRCIPESPLHLPTPHPRCPPTPHVPLGNAKVQDAETWANTLPEGPLRPIPLARPASAGGLLARGGALGLLQSTGDRRGRLGRVQEAGGQTLSRQVQYSQCSGLGKQAQAWRGGGRGLSLNFPLGIASPHQAGPESRAGLPCPPGTSQRAPGGAEGVRPPRQASRPGAFSSRPSVGKHGQHCPALWSSGFSLRRQVPARRCWVPRHPAGP